MSKCGEGFHVETAFDYKGISSHERIGYGECATGKCGFGQAGGDVGFIHGTRRRVDGHKIIKFLGEKVGAQLLVVGHDRNMPNGGV